MFNKSELQNLAWASIAPGQWARMIKDVKRTQNRIYRASVEASKNGRKSLMWWLQGRLINSTEAKLVAIRRVLTNKGGRTVGTDEIDRETIKKEIGKYALQMNLDGKSSTIARVWVPKPGKAEMRPLGIPTLLDRAKQALVLMALEPEWEAKFEPNSYGFRPGRNAHDAIESLFNNLNKQKLKWVFDADIRKCFDRINHEALIQKLGSFPAVSVQVSAWLKAGILDPQKLDDKGNPEIVETRVGTPQGGIISPLLANIALHGLENTLRELVREIPGPPNPGSCNSRTARMEALGIVRYADDFVLTHANLEILKLCIEATKEYLGKMGLELSEEKSKLRISTEGFNFLGFRLIKVYRNSILRLKIYPQKEKVKKHSEKISEIISQNKASAAEVLIGKLAPVVRGWAEYYKYCESNETFKMMDFLMYQKLRAWVFRKSTRLSRTEAMNRCFPEDTKTTYMGKVHRDNWVFKVTKALKKGNKIFFLPKYAWIKAASTSRYVKVKGCSTPYDGNHLYWMKRSAKYGPTREAKLIKVQQGRCNVCKGFFAEGEHREIDHIVPKAAGGVDQYVNLQLLCVPCHREKSNKDLVIIQKYKESMDGIKKAKAKETRAKTKAKRKMDAETEGTA